MNVVGQLRRLVFEFMEHRGCSPQRIVLSGENAKSMADYLTEQQFRCELGGKAVLPMDGSSGDQFLRGKAITFMGIPVIAELHESEVLRL